MNIFDYIVLAVLFGWIVFSVIWAFRRRKNSCGGCHGGCSGCKKCSLGCAENNKCGNNGKV